MISKVALHVNESMRQVDNFKKLMEVQKKLIGDGGDNLISPSRVSVMILAIQIRIVMCEVCIYYNTTRRGFPVIRTVLPKDVHACVYIVIIT